MANTHWRNHLFLGENTPRARPPARDRNTPLCHPGPLSPATGQDRHSIAVDYDIFVNVPKLDCNDLKIVQRVLEAEDYDFRLKPGSAAVDKGVAIPTVSDRFHSAAPDLGAIEQDEPQPHYGPRP